MPKRTAGKPALCNRRSYVGDADNEIPSGTRNLHNKRPNYGEEDDHDKTKSKRANFYTIGGHMKKKGGGGGGRGGGAGGTRIFL